MTTASARRVLSATLCILALAVLTVVSPSAQVKPEVALKAAIDKEVVDGDLKVAIELYRRLANGSDRAVAAQALVRMGQCYEKLGSAQTAEARKAYERLVRDFADQRDAAQQARARLAALGTSGSAAAPAAATLRRVYDGSGRPQPTISSDGRYAVFNGVGDKLGILTVRDLVSGAERTIPRPEPVGKDEEILAAVAPDGRQLAYALVRMKGASPDSVLKVVGVDGGNPRVLMTLSNRFCLVAQWSDDGKSLLVMDMPADYTSIRQSLVAVSDGSVLWTLDKKNMEDESLAPDGRFLASIDTVEGSKTIVLLDPKTRTRNRLTAPGAISSNPVWTQDGQRILFLCDRSGTRDLWVVRVADGRAQGEPTLARPGVGDITLLRVSGEGTLYYWKQSLGSRWIMASLDRTSGKIGEPLTPFPGMHSGCGFDWSPDSSAFVHGVKLLRNPGDESGPCTLLAIRTLADGRERVLSPGLSNIRRPKWSPDGSSFLVFGSKDGVFGIYSVDSATGAARLLVQNTTNPTTGDNILAGTWTPDGKGFYFPRVDGTNYRLMYRDAKTEQETERYTMTGPPYLWFLMMSVSRDGDVSLAGGDGRASSVMVFPAAGNPPRTVFTGTPPNNIRWAVWAADGRAIWATRYKSTPDTSDQQELIRIPMGGGEPEYTGLVASGLTPFPSPDGTRMAVATLPRLDEIWALDHVIPPSKVPAPAAPAKK